MKETETLLACYTVGWVLYWTGKAAGSVGDMPSSCEPAPWYLPLIVLMLIGVPCVTAYWAGRKHDDPT